MNHEVLKRVIYDQHEVIKKARIVDRDIVLERDANYVLTGCRRAGKTTLLYKRVQDLISSGVNWNQIVYINFDDERLIGFNVSDFDDVILTAEEMSKDKHYFYFDEIQNIDGWEKFAIRIANQGYKVDITGSNAKMLSGEVAAKLGGRYISKEIMPYSFNEFLRSKDAIGEPSAKGIGEVNALLEEYLTEGGFPGAYVFANKRDYLNSIYDKVLYGDIVAHYKIRNEGGIKLLVKKVAESIGQDISFTRLQNTITGVGYKLSKDKVIDYCAYCKEAFLLFTVENYYAAFVDKASTPKYFFVDNGILNLFLIDERTALLENVVAATLYRKHKEELYYLKGAKSDVDFYLSDSKVAIQVAYSLKNDVTYRREVDNLLSFASSSKEKHSLLIVTYEEEKTIVEGGYKIEVVPLKKFLLGQY